MADSRSAARHINTSSTPSTSRDSSGSRGSRGSSASSTTPSATVAGTVRAQHRSRGPSSASLPSPAFNPSRRSSSGSSASPHRRRRPCPEHLIAAVRERASIAELFPAAALQRCGRSFLTTCPWHDDRRPSLTVNPHTNRVHCFVCARGTDAIGWLQDRQGLSFAEAVHELAHRHGIAIPEQDPDAAARAQAEQRERQRLLAWRERQQRQFHQALLQDLNQLGPAAIALRQRGLTPDTASAWGLGLNGTRLMLPVADGQGRIRAFSGRTLTGEEPKYCNSANDALFRKQELLFGLHHAANAIRRTGEALLVEGPLDAIQLHQAGLSQAIAAMGTTLSIEQRQLLQRAGAKRLLVAYDGDTAGITATGRLIATHRPAAMAAELELLIVSLPAGTDPDALIRQLGPDAFRQLLAAARHWLGWELDQLLAPLQADPDNLSVVQRCEQQARQLLALLPPGALRQRAEQRLREALGVVPKVAHGPQHQALKQHGGQTTVQVAGVQTRTPCNARMRAERRALRLFLCSPSCREALAPLQITTPLHHQAQQCLVEAHRRLPQAMASGTEDALPAALLALCPQLEPNLAALLEELCSIDATARQALHQSPEQEMQAILEALEPAG